MNKALWLSYDLGVKGDYEGLYAWLDDHNAEECGNSVAFLHYEYCIPETCLEVPCVAFNIMIEENGRLHALAARPVAFGRAAGASALLFLRLTSAEGISCVYGRAVRSALGALQSAVRFLHIGVRVLLDALRGTARPHGVAHQRGESPA